MVENDDPGIPGAEQTLQSALNKAGASAIPPQLHDVTARHLASLNKLVAQLRAAGVDEEMVRHSTKELLQSYEDELLNVLFDLNEEETK